MKKTTSFLVMLSFLLQHVGIAALFTEDVKHLKTTGTLGEKAYYYRYISNAHAMNPEREVPITREGVGNPRDLEAINQPLNSLGQIYLRHQEFKRKTIAQETFQTEVGEKQKIAIDVADKLVDTTLGFVLKTPSVPSTIIKPIFDTGKGIYVNKLKKNIDDKISKYKEETESEIAYRLAQDLKKTHKLEDLDYETLNKLYKSQNGGNHSLVLNSGYEELLSLLDTKEKVATIGVGLKQEAVSNVKRFATVKEAFDSLDKRFGQIESAILIDRIKAGKEMIAARALLNKSAEAANLEAQNVAATMQKARALYFGASTPSGALLAEGVMTHLKLDETLGKTTFLVTQEMKRMTSKELLDYAKDHNGLLPSGEKLSAKDEIALKLDASKQNMTAIAKDFQTVGTALISSAQALGMEGDDLRALNAGIGAITGVIMLAAASTPVGYIVAIVAILCSVMSMFGGSKNDNGQNNLIVFMQQLAEQVAEIKKQIFELKVMITKQHYQIMKKLDLEFGKTKDLISLGNKTQNFTEYEKRYGECLALESSFNKWMIARPERFNLEHKDILEFFTKSLSNRNNFAACLSWLDKVKLTHGGPNKNDYFLIFDFDSKTQEADYRFNQVESLKKLLAYLKTQIKKLTPFKDLNGEQLEILSYKALGLVPPTLGWESFKNLQLQKMNIRNIIPTTDFEIFQNGLVSVSTVFAYFQTLSFLNQFAPFLDENGDVYEPEKRLSDALPSQRFFENSATAKIADLLEFVDPYLKAALAQENLLSGAIVADAMAKSYLEIERGVRTETNIYSDKISDIGTQFSEADLFAVNPVLAQNFISHIIRYQNPSSPNKALVSFNHELRTGDLKGALSFLPSEIQIFTQTENALLFKLKIKDDFLQKLIRDKQNLESTPELKKSNFDKINKRDTEIARVKSSIEEIEEALAVTKAQKQESNTHQSLGFVLPPTIDGDLPIADLKVFPEDTLAVAFNRSIRLNQLISMRHQMDQLDFEYNWTKGLNPKERETLDNDMESLQ